MLRESGRHRVGLKGIFAEMSGGLWLDVGLQEKILQTVTSVESS